MPEFELHERLEADSHPITDLPLSTVRLIQDANYPWLLLVPRKAGLVEIIDLDEKDQQQLTRETALASRVLQSITECEKLNVAALGNMVPQLHVHVIARFKNDAAWPGPVWGVVPARDYPQEHVEELIEILKDAFEEAGNV